MEGLREYVLSVVAGAILCAVLTALAGTGKPRGQVMKLVTGTFLTLALIRPIAGIEWKDMEELIAGWKAEAAAAAALGEGYYEESLAAVIQERYEAYILDKAQALGAEVEVTVSLDEDCLPEEAVIRGPVSPYVRGELKTMLAAELGIPKERQIWIG